MEFDLNGALTSCILEEETLTQNRVRILKTGGGGVIIEKLGLDSLLEME